MARAESVEPIEFLGACKFAEVFEIIEPPPPSQDRARVL
jgi:hypothetical protein